ncbi:hypothetical protein E2C01_042919 [Portunus trituberculatus]|uniref:Uncharacterized protein n=1 Tax=Portunus trituberculatus TaxID=210409 RepID=A0A5B7FUV8_PORTR|nr:hypothetical protein [Portunus trituberculatus]
MPATINNQLSKFCLSILEEYSNHPRIRITTIQNTLLSGATHKRIQTYRALDPSIPLGGSTYSDALPLSPTNSSSNGDAIRGQERKFHVSSRALGAIIRIRRRLLYVWEALFSFRPLVAHTILFIVVPILGAISPPKHIFGVTT